MLEARLAEVPVETVVVNHVMGLYELAAIHLGADPPRLGEASLAIDAVACLVEGLGSRLGPDAPTWSTRCRTSAWPSSRSRPPLRPLAASRCFARQRAIGAPNYLLSARSSRLLGM